MKRIPDPLLRMRNWSYYLEQDDLAKKKKKEKKKPSNVSFNCSYEQNYNL